MTPFEYFWLGGLFVWAIVLVIWGIWLIRARRG